MLQYLVLLMDNDVPSFCYYQPQRLKHGIISYELLKKTVEYCLKCNISLNVVYSNNSLPKDYYSLLNSIPHTKIVPFGYRYTDEYSAVVINKCDMNEIVKLNTSFNLILRIKKDELDELDTIIRKLIGHFNRLNVVLMI